MIIIEQIMERPGNTIMGKEKHVNDIQVATPVLDAITVANIITISRPVGISLESDATTVIDLGINIAFVLIITHRMRPMVTMSRTAP